MDLQLVKMGPEYREMAEDMLREWKASGEAIIPSAIDQADIHDFPAYLDSLELTEAAWCPILPFSAWIKREISWWEPSISVII